MNPSPATYRLPQTLRAKPASIPEKFIEHSEVNFQSIGQPAQLWSDKKRQSDFKKCTLYAAPRTNGVSETAIVKPLQRPKLSKFCE